MHRKATWPAYWLTFENPQSVMDGPFFGSIAFSASYSQRSINEMGIMFLGYMFPNIWISRTVCFINVFLIQKGSSMSPSFLGLAGDKLKVGDRLQIIPKVWVRPKIIESCKRDIHRVRAMASKGHGGVLLNFSMFLEGAEPGTFQVLGTRRHPGLV